MTQWTMAARRGGNSLTSPQLAAVACLLMILVSAGQVLAAIQIEPVRLFNDWSYGAGLLSYLDDPEAADETGEAMAVAIGADFSLRGRLGGQMRYTVIPSLIGNESFSLYRQQSTLDVLLSYSLPVGPGQLKLYAGPSIVDLREDTGFFDGGFGLKYGAGLVWPLSPKLVAEGYLRYAPPFTMKRRFGTLEQERYTSRAAEEQFTLTYSLDSLMKNLSLRLSLGASQLLQEHESGRTLFDYDLASLGASYRF